MATDDTPSPDLEGTTEVEQQLTELIDAHEQIAWDRVPTLSVPEAATWTQRLQEARQEAAQKQRLVADGGTSRRRFLGAAATVTLLAGTSEATSHEEGEGDAGSDIPDGSTGEKLRPAMKFRTNYPDRTSTSLTVRRIQPAEYFEYDWVAELDFNAGPMDLTATLDREAVRDLIAKIEDDDGRGRFVQGVTQSTFGGEYSDCEVLLGALSSPQTEKLEVHVDEGRVTVELEAGQRERFLKQLRSTLGVGR